MLTLEDINNHVYFLFRKSQAEAMHSPRLGKIHVSDLIKPCMRYVIYKKISTSSGMNTEELKSLYFGQLVHAHSQLAEKEHHEKFLGYDYVEDKVADLKWAQSLKEDDPKHLDIIYGSIDDVIKIGGEWVIVDKKTTGSIGYFQKYNSRPSDSHKAQINAYGALLKKCYGMEAKRGCVMYISNQVVKETRDKPTALSFKLNDPDKELAELIEKAKVIKDALTNKTLPKRTKNFLCDGMCPFATTCFEDNRTKYE